MMYQSVTLEMSLKPFKQTDEAFIREVFKNLFWQWRPLIKNGKTVSVMLWCADGSEILEYSGDLDEPFEWACWVGTANLPKRAPEEDPAISLHSRKRLYRPYPPVMTYRILQTIVRVLKEEGKKVCPDAVIRVGETFDIGPEFAISDFKYRRHTEILGDSHCDHLGFVDSTLSLHADERRYAAYPEGIPEGLPFGTFLGAQTNAFFADMGFDYLWLSNGLGFSADPWKTTGKIYDGERFYPERLQETKRKVFAFWKLFRDACPTYPLEVRGTNNSVGIDYATDGVPTYSIYRAGFDITAPPNSPWAALNGDYGLELMGHMTRICEVPDESKGFLFRFYIHDPWWLNSPWYDRYDSQPHDIYLATAVTRIDPQGRVRRADTLNLLSVDNSFGDLPDCCVNEPLPHLLKAAKDAGDAPAPLVWVYPMREYCAAKTEEELAELYAADQFIRAAINHGLPLNCVVSTESFMKHDNALYQQSILLSPVPTDVALAQKLEQCGKVIYYGSRKALDGMSTAMPKVDTAGNASACVKALEAFGLCIRYEQLPTSSKKPVMTITRSNNGFFFSVFSADTTTDTLMQFPLGAPVLIGGETQMEDGFARYRFPQFEHRECRVFVKQKSGVISCHEATSVQERYRRRIRLLGLEDAELCFFPETYCQTHATVGFLSKEPDMAMDIDERFRPVYDEKYGHYYRAEHITGACYLCMPRRNGEL